jgi:hypothetical protein
MTPKCPGCGRNAITKPVAVCGTCHREVVVKKFGSRAKGCKFEVEVAKLLSTWWGEERSFRRTPLSGAWDKRAGGDLVTPAGFQFTVECKSCEGWELSQLISSGRRAGDKGAQCLLEKHWSQAVRECQEGKRPMLVFTRNHQSVFYMLSVVDWNNLEGVQDEGILVLFRGSETRIIGLLDDLLTQWKRPGEI